LPRPAIAGVTGGGGFGAGAVSVAVRVVVVFCAIGAPTDATEFGFAT